jgi:hypothetical protein
MEYGDALHGEARVEVEASNDRAPTDADGPERHAQGQWGAPVLCPPSPV